MQVESSAISDIGYDAARQRLIVTFHDGDRYLYRGVPPTVGRAFLEAESKGQFFAFEIRDRYPFSRL